MPTAAKMPTTADDDMSPALENAAITLELAIEQYRELYLEHYGRLLMALTMEVDNQPAVLFMEVKDVNQLAKLAPANDDDEDFPDEDDC